MSRPLLWPLVVPSAAPSAPDTSLGAVETRVCVCVCVCVYVCVCVLNGVATYVQVLRLADSSIRECV